MTKAPEGYDAFDEEGTFIGVLGPVYLKRLGDRTVTYLELDERHTNPMGVAHGGLLMTLLDITLGSTAGAKIDHVGVYPTIQLNCNFLRGAKLGDVVEGRAEVTRLSRTLAFVSGQLEVGGQPIATATAVFRNPPGVEIPRS
ncbi:MAG: PaaI family thioesterase [Pseudomonadota bacterium]|nr:PaaI family thioesterase [Pseudomonadota bacterium]MEE2859674.1 PaaI family thioesterase [Pseudomonadota bacterium]